MTFVILTAEEFHQHSQVVTEQFFTQSVEMAAFLEKRGMKTTYVGWKENEVVTISALLYSIPMTGGLYMELNQGPLWSDNNHLAEFYHSLTHYAKTQGVLELVVKPYNNYQLFDNQGQTTSTAATDSISLLTQTGFKHDGLQTGYPGGEPYWHYVKDLKNTTSNSLLKSLNSNSYRNIKKAKRLGVSVRSIQRQEIPQFKQIIEETGARQGFQDKPLTYYQQLYDAFDDKALFLVAELNPIKALAIKHQELDNLNPKHKTFKQEQASLMKTIHQLETLATKYGDDTLMLASLLLIFTETEACYLFGGSYSAFQKLSAPFLLQYQAMLESLKRGIPSYNFLGIQGVFDGSDGVLRFKQNFNGYITRKMGTFRYYPRPLKYKVIQGLKKLLKR